MRFYDKRSHVKGITACKNISHTISVTGKWPLFIIDVNEYKSLRFYDKRSHVKGITACKNISHTISVTGK